MNQSLAKQPDKTPIKILWVNAINNFSEVETRYPNLGIGYLIAALEKEFGPECFRFKVIDNKIEETLQGFTPDIVAISAVSQNYHLAQKYAHLSKHQGATVLVGGVHISFLPHTLTENMDIGLLGESETTLVELLHHWQAGQFAAKQLHSISGIVFRDNDGQLVQTEPRPPLATLDQLAKPNRSYLPQASHTYLFTSRGCPYRCNFCASSRFWNQVRYFSAERVVAEIEELIRYQNARFISFFDDLFIADKKRFFTIVEQLQRKGLTQNVRFSCSLRANTVSEDIVEALKEMGVVSVGMGLESGNQRILSWLKGTGISVEHNRNAVRLLRQKGIMANASFVIGAPDETEAEILDTYKFIKSEKVSLFDTYVLTPFPGTPVWQIALERGLVSEDEQMDWSRLNVNFGVDPQKAIILSETLSRRQLIRIYKKFQRYRLLHNASNIWQHPMLSDLPRYLLKQAREKLFSRPGK
jgi:radical SAM superfamily enzyme YgiQ (UPF0313 family)